MYRFAVAFGCFVSIVLAAGCQCLENRYMGCGYATGMGGMPSLSCGDCGDCGDNCDGYRPGHPLGNLMGCASGCGEVYWGEWTSDPPDCCDPCDDCGNWVGTRFRGFPFVQHLLAGLHGALTGQCAALCGGCPVCLNGAAQGETAYYEEEFVAGLPAEEVYMAPEATQATGPTEAAEPAPESAEPESAQPIPAARPQARYQPQPPGSMSFFNLPSHRTADPALR